MSYRFRWHLASRIRMFHPDPADSRNLSLYTQQCYMSYRFCWESLLAGSGCSILIPFASCQQTCMTYTIAACTVINSWWWIEELSETCRVLFQNKFEKSVNLVGFIISSACTCCTTDNFARFSPFVDLQDQVIVRLFLTETQGNGMHRNITCWSTIWDTDCTSLQPISYMRVCWIGLASWSVRRPAPVYAYCWSGEV